MGGTCPDCHGNKYVECPKCHGYGKIVGLLGDTECPWCKGARRIVCPRCGGKGYI